MTKIRQQGYDTRRACDCVMSVEYEWISHCCANESVTAQKIEMVVVWRCIHWGLLENSRFRRVETKLLLAKRSSREFVVWISRFSSWFRWIRGFSNQKCCLDKDSRSWSYQQTCRLRLFTLLSYSGLFQEDVTIWYRILWFAVLSIRGLLYFTLTCGISLFCHFPMIMHRLKKNSKNSV